MDPRWGGDPLAAFAPEWEEGMPRLTEGEPRRAAKLRALGNAIVPQVAYVLLAAMVAAEAEQEAEQRGPGSDR